MTVNGRPAIVTIAVRVATLVLVATDNRTCPSPLPLDPLTAIHSALEDADHAQPDWTETLTVVAPPAAAKDCADADKLGEHDGGSVGGGVGDGGAGVAAAASCVTTYG